MTDTECIEFVIGHNGETEVATLSNVETIHYGAPCIVGFDPDGNRHIIETDLIVRRWVRRSEGAEVARAFGTMFVVVLCTLTCVWFVGHALSKLLAL